MEREERTLQGYLAMLRRRKWVVVLPLLLVPIGTVMGSLQQEKLYRASSVVLLGNQSLTSGLLGIPDPTAGQAPDRVAQTQADLARIPAVASRVLRALRLTDRSARDFLGESAVRAKSDADLLEFFVTDRDRALAPRLATEYARQFTIYRRRLDTRALTGARRDVQSRLQDLRASGAEASPLYTTLMAKDQQLATLEALQTSNAYLVQPADRADQVQPRPLRNGVLAAFLGLALGLGLAFLTEALDTRVHSADEAEHALGLPLLARLAAPPRAMRQRDRLVTQEAPRGAHAEAFRILMTNLEFVNLDRGATTIMITSSVEREGKSTTVANLAVALARAGKRVVLVDLDLRRPHLDCFFDLEGRPGLTDVALGRLGLDDAVALVAVGGSTRKRDGGKGDGHVDGLLQVLPSGQPPPNPGEFVGTEAVQSILGQLKGRADVVLIDAPPLLEIGDAMILGARVDGVLMVIRLNVASRRMLAEARRLLEGSPATGLGIVVTDAASEETYGYSGYYRAPEPASLDSVA